jgi:3-dehydroquinate synthetase
MDPEFLLSLPARERRNGLAEVVKAGFIRDAGLLELLAGPGRILFREPQLRDRELLAGIIGRAAAIKAEVVAADEREGDVRRILNFGHTLGHALEKASHFKLKHGEAVSLGMVAALEFSVQLTGLGVSEAREGREVLASLGLPVDLPQLPREEILGALKVDKKKQGERLVFVLLKRLGEAVVSPEVPLGMIDEWLEANNR